MWAMEHFYQRKNMDDICFSNANHIDSFYKRMRRFLSPVGTDDCMSPKGEQGFEDIGTMIWIRHSHLGTKVATPEMWAQMETIMQYLDNVGAGPNNVGASSSLSPPA
ncbi:hypothetical protein H5410_051115 [Solanum commersonii]|uniref:Uncharacterized protein n=1 Tax=Solanum commersonii TaxID=4109 RepID=A0A9J5WZZ8_SOLCO|nr:hypothetical protein H5410_051115 [Solanum commersonii]